MQHLYFNKLLFVIVFVITHYTVDAFCSCNSYQSFIKGAKKSEIIVRGKVKEIVYKFEDNVNFYSKEERDDYYETNEGEVYGHIEILILQNIEIIQSKGNSKKTIKLLPMYPEEEDEFKILGGNFHCQNTFDDYEIGEDYIFLLIISEDVVSFGKYLDIFDVYFEKYPCWVGSARFEKNGLRIKIQSHKRDVFKSMSYRRFLNKVT